MILGSLAIKLLLDIIYYFDNCGMTYVNLQYIL